MVFMLTLLNIYYIIDPNLFALPEPQEDESATVKIERLKREEDEVLCRGHILNTLWYGSALWYNPSKVTFGFWHKKRNSSGSRKQS